MARILLTGVAGFIGSHCADRLLSRGDFVLGIDNLNAYYSPARKRANLREIEASKPPDSRFEFVEGDIRDQQLVRSVAVEHRIDAIVHLAAMAGVRASIEDPHLYLDVNVGGTLNLLEAAREIELSRFVFASTSSAYGRTERIPFSEDDTADRPLAPYPASKRAAELLGHSYHHLYGLHFTALRFFTVYGPRGRPDMMAYKVLDSVFGGQEVPLFNGGDMYRDWTYVDDIVAGIVAAVDTPLGFEVVNLGRGQPTRLRDFVDLVQSLAGGRASLRDEAMPRADVRETYADVSKARRLLGYSPRVSVEEGVREFWRWYEATNLKVEK